MESEVHGPSQIGEVDGTSEDIRVGRVGREIVEGGEESACVCERVRVRKRVKLELRNEKDVENASRKEREKGKGKEKGKRK